MGSAISVLVERGGVVEARHTVHAVAVREGEVTEKAGDPEQVSFMRSAAKPLQALPLALEAIELPVEQLAIACASHEALPEHLAAVRALLDRSGSSEDELECGSPHGSRAAHPCSGKHAAMLLRAKRHGWPLPGYRLAGHPVQDESRRMVAEATGLDPGRIQTAVDGCGVVTFAVSLRAMAASFARLAGRDLAGSDRVAAAMLACPKLIGGPSAPDTTFMRAAAGALAKRGAEGLLCIGLPDGTGVAVKVEDGANRAALPAAAAFLGVAKLAERPVFNSRGEHVGRVFPAP